MKRGIIWIINMVAKFFLVDSSKICVDKGSQVSWWRLGAKGGQLDIGRDCIINCRVDFDSTEGYVSISDRSYIGASHLVCYSRIEIAEDVIISWGVTIVDHNSHSVDWRNRKQDVARWMRGEKSYDDVATGAVYIGPKVWIGFGAVILKGVSIGEGAIVGAMSVVTQDIPAFTIVAGNPAKVVRNLKETALNSIDLNSYEVTLGE